MNDLLVHLLESLVYILQNTYTAQFSLPTDVERQSCAIMAEEGKIITKNGIVGAYLSHGRVLGMSKEGGSAYQPRQFLKRGLERYRELNIY